MIESLDYLASLFGNFISKLGSLNIISGISLLDLITGLTVIFLLIIFLFRK